MKGPAICIIALLLTCFNPADAQTRGIKYGYTGVTDVCENWQQDADIFEIANDNLIVHTPYLKAGNTYYSLLTRFDSYLCLVDSRRIPLPAGQNYPFERALLSGCSKSDGGFALVSNTGILASPFVVRNYDNQGNLIFSKAITATYGVNENTAGENKIIANPDNNHLYLIFPTYILELGHYDWSPLYNIVELSPIGNIVNSFRMKVPDDAIYTDGASFLYHSFWMGISDAKYVKGSNGPSSDRIWIAGNMTYLTSYDLDIYTYAPYVFVNGPVQASYFTQGIYAHVAIVDPQGTTGEVNMLLNQQHFSAPRLAITKNATPALPAEMMVIHSDDNYQPKIFRFMDHRSAMATDQYAIPYSFPVVYPTLFTDIKKHQNAILFSEGKYFGTLDPATLKINLREQAISNDPVLGYVHFLKGTTNKLYINYKNNSGAPSNLPSNYIVKEDLLYFNTTCKSNAVVTLTANRLAPVNYPLVTQLEPLIGVSVINEPYLEQRTKEIITFKNVCLNCSGFAAQKSSGQQTLENNATEGLVIYPNPATAYFEISKTLLPQRLEVYTMEGKLVKAFKKQVVYPVDGLAKGSYMIKIITAGKTINKMLVVS